MKKNDVLRKLDSIKEMSDDEIKINAKWIREVATFAYALIKTPKQK